MPESENLEILCKQSMGSGSEGKPVELVSNFFKISSSKASVLVYQYSVAIKQEQPEQQPQSTENSGKPFVSRFAAFLKKVSPEIIEKFIQQNTAVFKEDNEGADFGLITDGAQTIYSTAKLKLERIPEVTEMNLNGRMNRLVINLSLVSTIDLGEVDRYYAAKNVRAPNSSSRPTETVPAKVVPVYEQLFRCLMEKRFTSHQRNYYDLNDRKQLRCNRSFDAVSGFSTSVRLTEIGLAVNLHHKSAVLLSKNMETVKQLVENYLKVNNLADLQPSQIKRASKLLSGLHLKTSHTGKEQPHTIDGLSNKGAHEYTFTKEDGSTSTVQQHFREKYGIEVGPFPLVRSMTPAFRSSGNSREKIHLPMEVCQLLPKQFLLEHRQPSDVQTELLSLATLKPNVYFTKVVNFMHTVKQIDSSLLDHFGVDVSAKPVKLQGRVLPLPRVLDGSKPNQRYNQNKDSFYKLGQVPKKWAVFCYDSTVSKPEIDAFLKAFTEEAMAKGLNFPDPIAIAPKKMEHLADIQDLFSKIRKSNAFEFVLLVIPVRKNIKSKTLTKTKLFFAEHHNH